MDKETFYRKVYAKQTIGALKKAAKAQERVNRCGANDAIKTATIELNRAVQKAREATRNALLSTN